MKIEIDTHNATKEEVEELIEYLETNCWDYRKEKWPQSKKNY